MKYTPYKPVHLSSGVHYDSSPLLTHLSPCASSTHSTVSSCIDTSTWAVRSLAAVSSTLRPSSPCWVYSAWSWPMKKWWWTSFAWHSPCRYFSSNFLHVIFYYSYLEIYILEKCFQQQLLLVKLSLGSPGHFNLIPLLYISDK